VIGCKPEAEVERDRLAAEQQAAAANQGNAPLQAQKAETGVTGKGKSLDGVSDYNPAKFVSGPASVLLKAKEKVFFEIQLPQAMKLFQATHGRTPKSHEEFMQEVVTNQLRMPELPSGLRYRYRPDLGELWVEPTEGNADANAGNGSETKK
jgi:hypothetical protein